MSRDRELQVLSVAPSARATKRLSRLVFNARVANFAAQSERAGHAEGSACVGDVSSGEEGVQADPKPAEPTFYWQRRIKEQRKVLKRSRCVKRKKETNDLTRRLVASECARSRLEAEKADLCTRLEAEVRKCEEETKKYQSEKKSNIHLQQRLEELERRQRATARDHLHQAASTKLSQQTVAKQIAELECRPLRQSSFNLRPALKKKLLLKWHPDKQPSSVNADLATQVMQEMQRCPDWSA